MTGADLLEFLATLSSDELALSVIDGWTGGPLNAVVVVDEEIVLETEQ